MVERSVVLHYVPPRHQPLSVLVEVGRRHTVGERLPRLDLEPHAPLWNGVPLHCLYARRGVLVLGKRGVVADVLRPRGGELHLQLPSPGRVGERHVLVGEGVVQRRGDSSGEASQIRRENTLHFREERAPAVLQVVLHLRHVGLARSLPGFRRTSLRSSRKRHGGGSGSGADGAGAVRRVGGPVGAAYLVGDVLRHLSIVTQNRRGTGRNIETSPQIVQTVLPHDAPVHGERTLDAVVDASGIAAGTRVVLHDAVPHRQRRRVVSVVGAADSSRLCASGRRVVPDNAVSQGHGFSVMNAAPARVSAHGAVVHRQIRVVDHASALRAAPRTRVAACDRQLVERAVGRHVEHPPAPVLLDHDGAGDRQGFVDEDVAVHIDGRHRGVKDDRISGGRVLHHVPERSHTAVSRSGHRTRRRARRSREAEQRRQNTYLP